MTFFTWTQELDVHVPAMNAGHVAIIERMNALHDQIAGGAAAPLVTRTLEQLYAVTVEHFRAEEAHMTTVAYEELAMHKVLHERLLSKLAGFQAELSRGGGLGEAFFDFLRFWLLAHIKGVDAKYGALAVAR
ncbi:MAG: bacteriohemerythrin [Acidimicrobiales bacterium]